MRKPTFKVDEEDYKLLQNMKAIDKENTQKNRQITMRKNQTQISHYTRMVTDKQDQIAKKDYREKSNDFVSGLKPQFMLENEIDELNGLIADIVDTDKAIKEEYEKAKK